VSFTVAGRRSSELAAALARRAVFVSNGDFYATTLLAKLGLHADGLVRVGCACYTTEQEIERLLDGVRAELLP
jgi:selenocysteine lyase/cysteine desulfurase